MADRTWIDAEGRTGKFKPSRMPEENIGHVCTYVRDSDDPNFKYCIYCGRVRYRTNAEILGKEVDGTN